MRADAGRNLATTHRQNHLAIGRYARLSEPRLNASQIKKPQTAKSTVSTELPSSGVQPRQVSKLIRRPPLSRRQAASKVCWIPGVGRRNGEIRPQTGTNRRQTADPNQARVVPAVFGALAATLKRRTTHPLKPPFGGGDSRPASTGGRRAVRRTSISDDLK